MVRNTKALLFAAFGVSDPAAAETTIAPILTAAAGRWPHRRVALAYTSDRVRKALKSRCGVEVDSVPDGLKRLFYDGFGEIIVQPLLMADGKEYRKLLEQVMLFQMRYPEVTVRLSVPLLWTAEDAAELAEVLCSAASERASENADHLSELDLEIADPHQVKFDRCGAAVQEVTCTVYVGHGVEPGDGPLAGSNEANWAYGQLAAEMKRCGCENGSGVRTDRSDILIGTLKGEPGFAEVVKQLNRGFGVKCPGAHRASGEKMHSCEERSTVILKPLMLTAGVHAKNDIAGAEADSWKSRLEALDYEVRCELTGLGEDPAIHELFLKRAARAMEDM